MKRLLLAGLVVAIPYSGTAAVPVPPLVGSEWVKANACEEGVVVLDIRSEKIDGQSMADYRRGHIPCAIHTDYIKAGWRAKVKGVPGMLPPVGKLETLIGDLGIGNDSHVVVAARGHNAKSMGAATRVYWTFKVLGHDRVSVLNRGTLGYAADKANRLEEGANEPRPATFKARLRDDMLVDETDLQTALQKGVSLVDYREPDQYLGINRHAKVRLHGTLPGAANVPLSWLTVNNTGRLRGESGLREVFREARVSTDEGHIAFCNTGHNSSLGWFVASELLGAKNVKVYDGSMAEWTRQEQPLVDRRLAVAD